jgi:hypothetical protein
MRYAGFKPLLSKRVSLYRYTEESKQAKARAAQATQVEEARLARQQQFAVGPLYKFNPVDPFVGLKAPGFNPWNL